MVARWWMLFWGAFQLFSLGAGGSFVRGVAERARERVHRQLVVRRWLEGNEDEEEEGTEEEKKKKKKEKGEDGEVGV